MSDEMAEKTEEKKVKAKTISKFFKFICTLGIIVSSDFKWLDLMPSASAGEICAIWATVYGIGAGTIDLNIMFDKFTRAK